MRKRILINNKETNYEICRDGSVIDIKTNKKIKGNQKKTGYIEYCLYLNGKKYYYLAHRLVASYFIPNPLLLNQVNHIDGNKLNNCVDNLEWADASDNNKHAWDNNLNHAHIKRAVKQYDLNHNFIKMYESITDAVKATGATKIREVANGNRKTAGGYIWEWVEDFIPEDRGKAKKVAQLDDEGNIIAIFDSVSEASRKTGANRQGISATCLGKQKKCFNYYWKFFNDDIVQ